MNREQQDVMLGPLDVAFRDGRENLFALGKGDLDGTAANCNRRQSRQLDELRGRIDGIEFDESLEGD